MRKSLMNKSFYTVDVLTGDETEVEDDLIRVDFGNGYIELSIEDGSLHVRGMSSRVGTLIIQPIVGNAISVRLK